MPKSSIFLCLPLLSFFPAPCVFCFPFSFLLYMEIYACCFSFCLEVFSSACRCLTYNLWHAISLSVSLSLSLYVCECVSECWVCVGVSHCIVTSNDLSPIWQSINSPLKCALTCRLQFMILPKKSIELPTVSVWFLSPLQGEGGAH